MVTSSSPQSIRLFQDLESAKDMEALKAAKHPGGIKTNTNVPAICRFFAHLFGWTIDIKVGKHGVISVGKDSLRYFLERHKSEIHSKTNFKTCSDKELLRGFGAFLKTGDARGSLIRQSEREHKGFLKTLALAPKITLEKQRYLLGKLPEDITLAALSPTAIETFLEGLDKSPELRNLKKIAPRHAKVKLPTRPKFHAGTIAAPRKRALPHMPKFHPPGQLEQHFEGVRTKPVVTLANILATPLPSHSELLEIEESLTDAFENKPAINLISPQAFHAVMHNFAIGVSNREDDPECEQPICDNFTRLPIVQQFQILELIDHNDGEIFHAAVKDQIGDRNPIALRDKVMTEITRSIQECDEEYPALQAYASARGPETQKIVNAILAHEGMPGARGPVPTPPAPTPPSGYSGAILKAIEAAQEEEFGAEIPGMAAGRAPAVEVPAISIETITRRGFPTLTSLKTVETRLANRLGNAANRSVPLRNAQEFHAFVHLYTLANLYGTGVPLKGHEKANAIAAATNFKKLPIAQQRQILALTQDREFFNGMLTRMRTHVGQRPVQQLDNIRTRIADELHHEVHGG